MTALRSSAAGLVVLLVVGLTATACGGDDDQDARYCAALKADQTIFADDGTGLELVTGLPRLEKLAAVAPDDLGDEWQTFLTSIESLRDAIRRAGVEPKDFVDGKPPSDLDPAERDAVAAAANELGSDDVVTAAGGIEQQAKDVCKLQLGL
ncbi:MAG: hypothetical protein ACJ72D_13450 [Marmoricola sp.]